MLTSTEYVQCLQVRRLWNKRMKTAGGRICDLCGYSTSLASSLAAHKKIHIGEKFFQCGSCDYSCTTARNLKTHSNTHTGEQPFQCSSCDLSFSQSGSLMTHSWGEALPVYQLWLCLLTSWFTEETFLQPHCGEAFPMSKLWLFMYSIW